uniref:sensor histidine kinase n=1 Tax=Actinomadura spongiicola TaxID=2303421 RepID=UPI0011C13E20|nr:histidine kinase [Actinomadura spongiicola]
MLPLLLLTAQLAAGPGLAATFEESLSARERTLGLIVGAVVAAALCLRRERPVEVLAVTVVLGTVTELTFSSFTAAPVLWVADLVALYSLAVHRSAQTAVTGGLFAVAAGCFTTALTVPPPEEVVAIIVLYTACYVVVIAFGQLRRQRVEVRRGLAARLDEAERERVLLAAAERERLARDLHDVAGHHLSAVTVHSTAALSLADRRPEMVSEALAVAVGAGREVLSALNRMVDVVGRPSEEPPDADLPELLSPLCAGLARLGIPVSVTVSGGARPLPAETVAAAYGVVQESLTNAMRHARGAPISVQVEYATGTLDVRVRNEKGAAWNDGAELSGGRGVEGMRHRVANVGGTLHAGPVEDGWSVHAAFPAPTRRRRELGWPQLLDAMAFCLCVGLPMLAMVPHDEALSLPPIGLAGLFGLLSAHAAMLWTRRRAPVATLAGVIGVDVLWCGLTLAGAIDTNWLVALGLAWTTEMIAVYSLTVYGPSAGMGFLGAVAVGTAGGLLAVAALAHDPTEKPFTAADGIAGVMFFGFFVTLAMLPLWAWGAAVRSRRRRGREWERSMVEAVAERTDHIVRAERYQVAVGLRDAVLDHTVRLTRIGESALRDGSAHDQRAALTVVVAEARAALSGMRGLLETMEEPMNETVDAAGARP